MEQAAIALWSDLIPRSGGIDISANTKQIEFNDL